MKCVEKTARTRGGTNLGQKRQAIARGAALLASTGFVIIAGTARAEAQGTDDAPRASASVDQAARSDEGIEEIIVTARKREERLQNVPISITAVSGEELRARGFTRLEDVQRVAPNLLMLP